MQDRYAFEQRLPPVDPQQDWNLVGGENENGVTTLEFWRKLITCDELDRDIEVRIENALMLCKEYIVREKRVSNVHIPYVCSESHMSCIQKDV